MTTQPLLYRLILRESCDEVNRARKRHGEFALHRVDSTHETLVNGAPLSTFESAPETFNPALQRHHGTLDRLQNTHTHTHTHTHIRNQ